MGFKFAFTFRNVQDILTRAEIPKHKGGTEDYISISSHVIFSFGIVCVNKLLNTYKNDRCKKYSSVFVILSEVKYINLPAFNFTPLPSPPPWGGNNNLRHTERSGVYQSICV